MELGNDCLQSILLCRQRSQGFLSEQLAFKMLQLSHALQRGPLAVVNRLFPLSPASVGGLEVLVSVSGC